MAFRNFVVHNKMGLYCTCPRKKARKARRKPRKRRKKRGGTTKLKGMGIPEYGKLKTRTYYAPKQPKKRGPFPWSGTKYGAGDDGPRISIGGGKRRGKAKRKRGGTATWGGL